jgi:hypothetical protein
MADACTIAGLKTLDTPECLELHLIDISYFTLLFVGLFTPSCNAFDEVIRSRKPIPFNRNMLAGSRTSGLFTKGRSQGAAGARSPLQLPRSTSRSIVGRGRSIAPVSAVLEMSKPSSSSNGAAPADPAALAEDVQREMHYRLASPGAADAQTLYDSLSWSVHNRLLDSFEKTHEHWKYVYLLEFRAHLALVVRPNRRRRIHPFTT